MGLRTGLDVSEKTKLYPVPGIVKCDVMPTLNKSPPSSPPLFFLCRCCPTRAMASSFTRFLDHTQRRATVGVGLLWTSDQPDAKTST